MDDSNFANPILIYLAGPIDGLPAETSREWREAVAEQGASDNVVFFSPAHAFLGTNKSNFMVVNFFNRMVIANCHGVLANLTEGLSVGTVREIEYAILHQKPVAVAGDLGASFMTNDLLVSDSLQGGLLDLVSKIAEARNQPPSFFGIPLTQFRALRPDEEEDVD